MLNMRSNEPQKDLLRRGNVSQKVIKKNDKKCEILNYVESDPKPIFTAKINNFRKKSDVFQTNSSRSRASVGGALGDKVVM